MEHWIDLFRQSLLAIILGLKVNWINYWLDYEVMLCLPVLHILISPSVHSSPTCSNFYRIFRQNEEPGVNTYFVRDVSSQSKEDSWLHLQSGCPGEGVFTQTYISFFSLWCVLSSFIIPAAMLHSNRLSSTILDRSRRYNLTVFSMEMTIQNFKLKCKNKILMKTEKLYSEEEVYYNTWVFLFVPLNYL